MTAVRILCVMGSGETAPTMAPVHRELIERVGGDGARAVLLDTPFGFQENADELVAKAQEHFQRSIGHPLELASLRRVETSSEVEREAAYSRVHDADYVFSGPGSPSYTLRQWRETEIPGLLRREAGAGWLRHPRVGRRDHPRGGLAPGLRDLQGGRAGPLA